MEVLLNIYTCPDKEYGGVLAEAMFERGHVGPLEARRRIAQYLGRNATVIEFKEETYLLVCGLHEWDADEVQAFVIRKLQELDYEVTAQPHQTLSRKAFNDKFK